MRIGVDARELQRGRMTGIGRFLTNLLCGLAGMDSGNDYFLFGYPELELDCDTKRFTLVTKNRLPILLWDQVYLASAVKEHKLDAFFSPYYKIPVFAGCKLLLTHHDFTFFSYPEYQKRFLYNLYLKTVMGVFNARAGKAICVSEFTKQELGRYFKMPADKAAVMPESPGPAFSPRSAAETGRARNKYRLEKPYLLYVGNSNPHKNVNGLLSAYGSLPPPIKEKYDLALVGVGGSMTGGGGVKVLRYVPDEDLAALYSGAELFVFPSFWEGFGLPPLEAMACGCPVLSSNASCMPEVLGDACLYFDPNREGELGARLAGLLESGGFGEKLKEKGLEKAASYTPEKMALRFLQVLKSI